MIQYPISNQQGLVDSVNYLLSGPSGLGQLFRGTNTETSDPLPGYTIQRDTGQIVTDLPIVTNDAGMFYLTDMTEYVTVPGTLDRVALTGSLNMEWAYTAYEPTTLEFTVALRRYFAVPSFSDTYNSNLLFLDKTCASKTFTYFLDTNKDGIDSVTVSGTKAALIAPAGGSFYPAVDEIISGLNANSPGAGIDARLQFQLTYGGSAAYDLSTNTKVDVITAGIGWSAGETITINGADLGGLSPANDMTVTVDTVSAGATSIGPIEIIFPTIYDQPDRPGLYRYVIEVNWSADATLEIDSATMNSRSITTQLIKS